MHRESTTGFVFFEAWCSDVVYARASSLSFSAATKVLGRTGPSGDLIGGGSGRLGECGVCCELGRQRTYNTNAEWIDQSSR